MNTLNASTGYLDFQLCLGWSPCIIPPIIPTSLPDNLCSAASAAEDVINRLTNDITDAKDNLLQAKMIQTAYANKSHGCEGVYQPGDKPPFHISHVVTLLNHGIRGGEGGFSSIFLFGCVGLTPMVIPNSSPTHLNTSKDRSELLRSMESKEREVCTHHARRCLSEDVQSECKRLSNENNKSSIHADGIELDLW